MQEMSITSEIEMLFVRTLALLIKENFQTDTEYRRGWFDAYAQAFHQMTGKTMFQLVNMANSAVDGSGKKLEMR